MRPQPGPGSLVAIAPSAMAQHDALGRSKQANPASNMKGGTKKKATDAPVDPDLSMEGKGTGDGAQDGAPMDTMEEEHSNVCAACDDGGGVVVCEGGRCMRAFHIESDCNPLQLNAKGRKRLATYVFTCPNCITGRQNCFVCKKEGKEGIDVFRCKETGCGRFYHPGCVGASVESMKQGNFVCASHTCTACGQRGHGKPVQWKAKPKGGWEVSGGGVGELIPCLLCLQSFHEAHLPKECSMSYCGCQRGGKCPKKGGHQPRRIWSRNWTKDGAPEVETSLLYCPEHRIEEGCLAPYKPPLFSEELLASWNKEQFQKKWLVYEYRKRQASVPVLAETRERGGEEVQETQEHGFEASRMWKEEHIASSTGRDSSSQSNKQPGKPSEGDREENGTEAGPVRTTRRTRAKHVAKRDKVDGDSLKGMVQPSLRSEPKEGLDACTAQNKSNLPKEPRESNQSKAGTNSVEWKDEGGAKGLAAGAGPSTDGARHKEGIEVSDQEGLKDSKKEVIPVKKGNDGKESKPPSPTMQVPLSSNKDACKENAAKKQWGGVQAQDKPTKRAKAGILLNIFATPPQVHISIKQAKDHKSSKTPTESRNSKRKTASPSSPNTHPNGSLRSQTTPTKLFKGEAQIQELQNLQSLTTALDYRSDKEGKSDPVIELAAPDKEKYDKAETRSKSTGEKTSSREGAAAAGSETVREIIGDSPSISHAAQVVPDSVPKSYRTATAHIRDGQKGVTDGGVSEQKVSEERTLPEIMTPLPAHPDQQGMKSDCKSGHPTGDSLDANCHQPSISERKTNPEPEAPGLKNGKGAATAAEVHPSPVDSLALEESNSPEGHGATQINAANANAKTADPVSPCTIEGVAPCARLDRDRKVDAAEEDAKPILSSEKAGTRQPQNEPSLHAVLRGIRSGPSDSVTSAGKTNICLEGEAPNQPALVPDLPSCGANSAVPQDVQEPVVTNPHPSRLEPVHAVQMAIVKRTEGNPTHDGNEVRLVGAPADGPGPQIPSTTAGPKSGSSDQASVKLKCLSDASTGTKEEKPSRSEGATQALGNQKPELPQNEALENVPVAELTDAKEAIQVHEHMEKKEEPNTRETKKGGNQEVAPLHTPGGTGPLPGTGERQGQSAYEAELGDRGRTAPAQQRGQYKSSIEASGQREDQSQLRIGHVIDACQSDPNKDTASLDNVLVDQSPQKEAGMPSNTRKSTFTEIKDVKEGRSAASGKAIAASTPRQGPSVMRMAKYFDCIVTGTGEAEKQEWQASEKLAQKADTAVQRHNDVKRKRLEGDTSSRGQKQLREDGPRATEKRVELHCQHDPASAAENPVHPPEDAIKRTSLDSATGPYPQPHTNITPHVPQKQKEDVEHKGKPSTSQVYAPSSTTTRTQYHTQSMAHQLFPPRRVCMMLRDILRPDDVILDFNCKSNEYHEAMVDLTREIGLQDVHFLSFSASKIKHGQRQKHHQCNWLEVVVGSLKVPGPQLVIGFCPPLQDVMVADLYIKHAARFRPRLLVVIAKRTSIVPNDYVVTYENAVGLGPNSDLERTIDMSLCRSSMTSTEPNALVLRIMKRADLPLFHSNTWDFRPVK